MPRRPSTEPCRALAALAMLGFGCGSDVEVGPQSSGDSAVASTTSTGSAVDPCAGKACGTECAVCNDFECLEGICDSAGACSIGGGVITCTGAGGVGGTPGASSSGVGGAGGDAGADCPADVKMGEACSPDGAWCPSARSCSGYLMCVDGAWTLVNPC